MTLSKAIETIRSLRPIFENSGVAGCRALTDEEMKSLAEAYLFVANNKVSLDVYLISILGEVIWNYAARGMRIDAEHINYILSARGARESG